MILQARKVLQALLVSLLAISVISCSARNDQQDTRSDIQQATIEWIDLDQLQPGPIRHESLTDEQLVRLRKVYDVFVEVDGQSIEAWIDDFQRDIAPDQELAVWELMATAYSRYCDNRNLSIEAKREVYAIILFRSMEPEDKVLPHLDLKILSIDDARKVMQEFPSHD